MIGKYDEEKSFDYENGFFLTSPIYRLGNIMAHYELYKKICNIPGDVVELGVFKGSSFIQWATFRELLENENSRKIIGFDVFGMFPESAEGNLPSDSQFIDNWNKAFENEFVSMEDICNSLSHKRIDNYELVKGDINETLPEYLKNNNQLRIAILHLDLDVYQPTKVGLELLYDLVVPNGIIVFDDYSTVAGATKAIDEFFEGKSYELQKFSFSHKKPSFLVKRC